MDADAFLAACRFLQDGSAMLLWGASAYLASLVPESLAGTVGGRLLPLRRVAIAVAVAATVGLLPLETAEIAGDWAGVTDRETVAAVLFQTSVGTAWLVEAGACLLLIATLVLPARWREAGTALASGLLLAGLTFTGHAVMQEGWVGVAHRINDAVHVLSAGAWVGALVPLLPVLGALKARTDQEAAATALRRFSTAGHGAVALVVATGVVNMFLVLRRWPTDWSSPYQAMLAIKIGLVATMTALATVNRYLFVPRVGEERARAITDIRRGTIAEIALGLAVVGLVAVFGMLDPK